MSKPVKHMYQLKWNYTKYEFLKRYYLRRLKINYNRLINYIMNNNKTDLLAIILGNIIIFGLLYFAIISGV